MLRKWALYILCRGYKLGTVLHYRHDESTGRPNLIPFRVAGGGILCFNKDDVD